MDGWTPQQLATTAIAVIAVVITLLARKDSRRSADAAERSALAAEQGVEQSDAERWDRKVEAAAVDIRERGFHAERTRDLLDQLAPTDRDRQMLFVEASKRAGATDNLEIRLGHLDLADVQLEAKEKRGE